MGTECSRVRVRRERAGRRQGRSQWQPAVVCQGMEFRFYSKQAWKTWSFKKRSNSEAIHKQNSAYFLEFITY